MTGDPTGTDPEPVPSAASAAVERTQLAWMRSGLSVAVVATLLIKHSVSVGGGRTGAVVGFGVLGAAMVVATVPVGRYLRSDGQPAYSTRAIRATAAVCTGIALLALVLVLVPMRD